MTIDITAVSVILMNVTVILAMGFAALIQSIAGFGFALVAMPILAGAIGLDQAAPLVAMTGLFNGTVIWLVYRQAFQLTAVLRLLGGSWLGVPIGLYGLRYTPESIAFIVLGLMVSGYAAYSLIGARLPKLDSPQWGYGFGMGAGILAGSYNIPGPAVVFYGQCRRWLPDEFKGNLAGYFWFNSVAVVVGHGIQRNFSHDVLIQCAIALPIVLTGFAVGTAISRRLNPDIFRQLVLWLLVATGIRLAWMGANQLL